MEELREAIATYADMAAARMREQQSKACGATVYAEFHPEYGAHPMEGGFATEAVAFRRPTSNSSEIWAQVAALVPRLFTPGRRYRKAGITFWGLDQNPREQPDFFRSPPPPPIADGALLAMDAINREYGRSTVWPLAEGMTRNWRMRRAMKTPRYTTSWDELPVAR